MGFAKKIILVAAIAVASSTGFAEQKVDTDRDKFVAALLGQFDVAIEADREHFYDDFDQNEENGVLVYSFGSKGGEFRTICLVEKIEVSSPIEALIVTRDCVQTSVADGKDSHARPAKPDAYNLEVKIIKTFNYDPDKPAQAQEITLNGKRLNRYEGGGE